MITWHHLTYLQLSYIEYLARYLKTSPSVVSTIASLKALLVRLGIDTEPFLHNQVSTLVRSITQSKRTETFQKPTTTIHILKQIISYVAPSWPTMDGFALYLQEKDVPLPDVGKHGGWRSNAVLCYTSHPTSISAFNALQALQWTKITLYGPGTKKIICFIKYIT